MPSPRPDRPPAHRIVADRGGRAAREHGAVDHHGDRVGDAEHRVHVVLDEQHRVAVLQRREELEHPLRLLGAHPRERLVEQQHLRAGSQAHRDLELPLLAMREPAGEAVRHRREACFLERRPGPGERDVAAVGARPQRGRALALRLGGEAAVLEHGEAREDRRALVAASEPGARATRLRPVRDVVAEQLDPSRRGRQLARQHVHERRLARAVGADHRVHRAARQRHRHVAHGDEATEAAGHPGGAQENVSRHERPPPPGAHAAP
jgi:hypothetical protein